uniref:hypothetical protein n=1 Tax=Roseburia hominis TaxID=301301 RepID=UPI001F20DFBD
MNGENKMGTGTRQTFYYKNLDAMKELAKEENIEINGSFLEELFWDKFVGTDDDFKLNMKLLYSGKKSLKSIIQNIIELMAYNHKYMKKDNLEFIKIIREVIGLSDWSDPEDNFTDYHISNRAFYVDRIARIFGIITKELEQRIELVKSPYFANQDYKPWMLEVQDKRRKDILEKEDNYSEIKIAEFKFREERLKNTFATNNTPGQVIDLIIENWEYFWNYSSVYEAIEYCVTLSENLNDKPIIRKKMRAFFKNLSLKQTISNLTAEHIVKEFEITDSTMKQLQLYLEKFSDINVDRHC